jgi:hypothetical protein
MALAAVPDAITAGIALYNLGATIFKQVHDQHCISHVCPPFLLLTNVPHVILIFRCLDTFLYVETTTITSR